MSFRIAARPASQASLWVATLTAAGALFSPTWSHGQPPPAVEELPLTEVPAAGRISDTLAFFASGDGGWVDLVKTVAAELSSQGIPVIGLSSLKYFWHQRPPDESARALELVLRHYLAQWHKERILLIGYSRGADMLPFMTSRLPADLRERIDLVALLAPATTTSFSIDLFRKSGAETATRPEVEKLRGLTILCVYGADESDSVCPLLPGDLAILEIRPGGHHFDHRYAPIAARILDFVHP